MSVILMIFLLLLGLFVFINYFKKIDYPTDLSGPISTVKWESRSGHNKLQLRGHVFEQDDVKNLLPGGHGTFN
jgi:hypothetical protein